MLMSAARKRYSLRVGLPWQRQEVRTLGRGAYGVVVAAVNRLDGRQYAVKRIRLDSASPAAFVRLLREVATLSRLQHGHIVRYHQVRAANTAAINGIKTLRSLKK